MEVHDDPVDRSRARRELAWICGGLVVAVLAVFTAGWWFSVLEQSDALTPVVVLLAVGSGLLATRRRRGPAWTGVRALVGLVVLALVVVGAVFGGCVASGCFN